MIIDAVAKAAKLIGRMVWCRTCGRRQTVENGLRLEAALRYRRAWPMPDPFATDK